MRKVARANKEDGFEPVQGSLEAKLGGLAFARADFKRGAVYEAVLVKSCRLQALVFIFTGSELDVVDHLIGVTELKLDLLKSGCESSAEGVPK